jgi:hypothetical protein
MGKGDNRKTRKMRRLVNQKKKKSKENEKRNASK